MDSVTHALLMEPPRVGYHNRVKSTQTANLIAYYPMWDAVPSGVMADYSGNGRNGTYSSKVGKLVGMDGLTAAMTPAVGDAAISSVNAAGLLAAFNSDEGTVSMWLRPNFSISHNVGWNYVFGVQRDAQNYLRVGTGDTKALGMQGVEMSQITRTANNVGKNNSIVLRKPSGSPSEWWNLTWVWSVSGNAQSVYQNGISLNTQTGLSAFVGAPTAIHIGGDENGGQSRGVTIQHLAIWDTVLTAAEIMSLAR